jgi:hypothetical protein
VRVLEKGVAEEGTRVVSNAGKNHYEPLRSSLGGFVAETTFIGNCNLFVEGISDQVLLAGLANHTRKVSKSSLDTLDLNQITIVPAGSASQIPYLVYLAKGRDAVRPPIIVLLDGDKAGQEARKALSRGGPKRKLLLPESLVLNLSDLNDELTSKKNVVTEIEDLIPLEICIEASKLYLENFCGMTNIEPSIDEVLKHIEGEGTLGAVVEACKVATSDEALHIDKIGFARTVLEVLKKDQIDASVLLDNARALFRKLNILLRKAKKETDEDRVSKRVERTKKRFLQDYPETALREQAYFLINDLESTLDDSNESDAIKTQLLRIRRSFKITEEMHLPIDDYEEFKKTLESLKYAIELENQPDKPESS